MDLPTLVLAGRLLFAARALAAPWGSVEPPDAYDARLRVIAQAIAEEAQEDAYAHLTAAQKAAILFVMSRRESTWRLEVHSGDLMGDGGRSACLMQVQRSRVLSADDWISTVGTSEIRTRNCFAAGLAYIVLHHRRCGRLRKWGVKSLARTLNSYGTGGACHPSQWAISRARKIVELEKRLR